MKKTVMKKNRLMGLGLPKHQLLEKAKIIFCHGRTFAEQRIFELDESCAMFGHPKFDAEKKTVLYIHGYMEAPSQESVNVIVNAYLKRNDHNILVLDWSSLADGNYLFEAVPNAKLLAIKMSEVVLDWIDEGLDVNKFHIVGIGLGAQVAGMIGRSVIKKSTGESKLVRISALDPTFPMFPAFRTKPVNKNDAEFVDIIHSDTWFYNSPKSTGTVDFWPNGGRTIQPDSPRRNYKYLINTNDRSNYRRSWWYWAESVRPSEHSIFLSVRANSWRSYKKGRVDNSAIIQMGIDCPLDARDGDYFLQTNVCKPFAKGVRGLHYEKVECK